MSVSVTFEASVTATSGPQTFELRHSDDLPPWRAAYLHFGNILLLPDNVYLKLWENPLTRSPTCFKEDLAKCHLLKFTQIGFGLWPKLMMST